MNKHIRFAYDKESDQYMFMKSVSSQSNGTESIFMPLIEMDRKLDDAIRNLTDIAEKSHRYTVEQMKFLYIHRNDSNVDPELSHFNEEYLTSLEKIIKEAKEQEFTKKQEVIDALKKAKDISVDQVSIFLCSFLSGTSKQLMKNLDFANIDNWELDQLDFDKDFYISENLNSLFFNEKDVKIFLTEKNNRETVKIVTDRETWEGIAYNQEYQQMLIDKDTRTSVYSISLEKYVEIEKGLKASTSAKDYLDQKLGGPSVIKQREKRQNTK